jgi:hypothetical protein
MDHHPDHLIVNAPCHMPVLVVDVCSSLESKPPLSSGRLTAQTLGAISTPAQAVFDAVDAATLLAPHCRFAMLVPCETKPEIQISKFEAKRILKSRKSETTSVSRLPPLDFEFVSDFDIRISDLGLNPCLARMRPPMKLHPKAVPHARPQRDQWRMHANK